MFEHLAVPIQVESQLADPIVDNIGRGSAKPYRTACKVRYRYGHHEVDVEKDFEFDGSSNPRVLWWIRGFAPWENDTKLPALIHDWLCEHPEELPRVIADAIFCAALGGVVLNGKWVEGVGPKRRIAMYLAVRLYAMLIGKG